MKIWSNHGWIIDFFPELLFRMSKDRKTGKDFHNKCDNKGITIIFIETNKGYKFGGYTELGWEGSGPKKDKSTFLFSFNKKEKYIAQNDNYSIFCSNENGPIFGAVHYNKKKQEKRYNEYKTFTEKIYNDNKYIFEEIKNMNSYDKEENINENILCEEKKIEEENNKNFEIKCTEEDKIEMLCIQKEEKIEDYPCILE